MSPCFAVIRRPWGLDLSVVLLLFVISPLVSGSHPEVLYPVLCFTPSVSSCAGSPALFGFTVCCSAYSMFLINILNYFYFILHFMASTSNTFKGENNSMHFWDKWRNFTIIMHSVYQVLLSPSALQRRKLKLRNSEQLTHNGADEQWHCCYMNQFVWSLKLMVFSYYITLLPKPTLQK